MIPPSLARLSEKWRSLLTDDFPTDPYRHGLEVSMRACANELESALQSMTAEEPPFCWVIPGDDNANANGFLYAHISEHGEFTKPLYAHPPLIAAKEIEGVAEIETDKPLLVSIPYGFRIVIVAEKLGDGLRDIYRLSLESKASHPQPLVDAEAADYAIHHKLIQQLASLVRIYQPEGAKVKWRGELIERESVIKVVVQMRDAIDAWFSEKRQHSQERAGWQPIETAPKDKELLLWVPENDRHYEYRTVGMWGKHNHVPIYGWIRTNCMGEEEVNEIEPTHWMPLPAPPIAAAPLAGEKP